ncbi:BCCT family transporter [Pontibacillus yanchengensis]|uniref:BCCT family transporter n=1 Tax=Pontibacillus yanchengensis TaxID=462910 RepID=A0A6I5A2A6_9BACI|nr:BCCT family transporter [Pontibacillus yanchengensis]MYL34940.1 BCCT family transporter [Pontibacillus yanchengensis]
MNSNGKNPVFWISAFVITFIVICGASNPKGFAKLAEKVFSFTTNAFGWFYLIAVMFFVIFCFYLAIGKYGKVRLGQQDERPKYSYFTWIGMLFSAGFGVGLVFWGVAEPMTHFSTPPLGFEIQGGSEEAARTAMRYSFFHWGIHQWSVFTVVGLVMAYFQYKKGRGALISSTMTLNKPQKKATWKTTVNTLAVIATVMGVATSLGMGILQINGGLNYMYDVPQNAAIQLAITGIMLVLYLISSTTGLDRGIKYLSNVNLIVALALMIFVLFLGPTVFIFESFTLGVGDYVQKFIQMSFYMTPYEGGSWVKDWTIFYWAWVIAWSPFVGSFVARISRGRTIREMVFGVLIVPPFIAMVWISVFGGAALHMDMFNNVPLAGAVNDDVTSALFATLEQFPFATLLSSLSIFLISVFLVTSADSATFVLGMMTSKGSMNPPLATKIVWGTLIAAISVVLIISSGLQGLQTASLTAALPFAIIMIMMCVNMFTSLRRDHQAEVRAREQAIFNVTSEQMATTRDE